MYAVSLEAGEHSDCGDLSTLLCKHIHALAIELGGLEAFGLTVNSERFPSSKSMKAIGANEPEIDCNNSDDPVPEKLGTDCGSFALMFWIW